jgi:DNA mismatch endonuclease (patch repair protein)
MKGNRKADTRPELALRSALHARGLRFRRQFPIRPPGRRVIRVDIAFTRARLAVFVDGCFWARLP